MTDHVRGEPLARRRATHEGQRRPRVARRPFATVLRRSAQCLRIAPHAASEGGAPTHRIIFAYPDGGEVPEAARRLTRAFGLGLPLVLSLRCTHHLCRVFAVSGAHAAGTTSLHFTVSLREFPSASVRWRARPPQARPRRAQAPVGATLPLPL